MAQVYAHGRWYYAFAASGMLADGLSTAAMVLGAALAASRGATLRPIAG